MSLGDKPAYPQNDALVNRLNNMDGMTLRQYYSGLAMQGITVNMCINTPTDMKESEALAIIAVSYADALIAELEKSNGNS